MSDVEEVQGGSFVVTESLEGHHWSETAIWGFYEQEINYVIWADKHSGIFLL